MIDSVASAFNGEYGIKRNTESFLSLLTPSEIRHIAAALGVTPTKKLGQNFVHDASSVRKIVIESGVTPDTRVLEVGPGLGSLTLALLEAGAYVSAIEIDSVLAQALPATIRAHNPQAAQRCAVLNADALSVTSAQQLAIPQAYVLSGDDAAENTSLENASALGADIYEPTHLVANLPYNVAVPVLLTLLEALPSLESVTVMVQAEVADRLAAQPGSRTYGVPSVKLAWYGEARRGSAVSRNVFWPVPNVDSALVHVDLYSRENDLFTNMQRDAKADRTQVFAVIDAAFSQRRKTLRSALAAWAGCSQRAEEILKAAQIDPQLRGEKLKLEEFERIAAAAVEVT
ncbi:dimethyladenosine transferase [Chlamydia trachomatis]|nr:dimethyladenosine transferase [Chlamydia trachomatis]